MTGSPISPGQALAALRRVGPRICSVCGKEFLGTSRALYHSRACASRADYQRHADARREKRRQRYRAEHPSPPVENAREGQGGVS